MVTSDENNKQPTLHPDERGFQLHRQEPRSWAKDWGYGAIEETEATPIVATGYGRKISLIVGKVLGGREAYGQNRVRYHIARGSHVIVEFTGTDDYDKTGRVFSVLKRSDGSQYKNLYEVPEGYRHFRIEPLADLVDDGRRYSGLAVVMHERELEAMARYALQRLIDRQQL